MTTTRSYMLAVLVAAGLHGPVTAVAACPARPLAACRAAGSASLAIDDRADAAGRRVTLSWKKGPATESGDFGSPDTSTTTSFCLWDAAGLLLSLEVPPAGLCAGLPCWAPLSAGFRYSDPSNGASGLHDVVLKGSAKSTTQIKLDARGVALPALPRTPSGALTAQVVNDHGPVCFEAVFGAERVSTDAKARTSARLDPRAGVPPLPSQGCGQASPPYTPGVSTADSLLHGGLTRTFRVHLPGSYDGRTPVPVVLNLHGGFGSGAQMETSSRITGLSDSAGFVAVSPDGVADPVFGIRTWNAGGCCGYAVSSNVDDVGFVRALLDRLEATACIDRRRVYAQGMSNGAILSHRLACELADRIRAIGPVAGTNMTGTCQPMRPVPVFEIHGSADENVPFAGGAGCGSSGVAYPSVPETIEGWRARAGCREKPARGTDRPDAVCQRFTGCAPGVDVEQCTVNGGGHTWPGGTPPLVPGIGNCPFGLQSQSFVASSELWQFFAAHPAPVVSAAR
ncbi:MAG: hypothetical protein RL698_2445 [Pseudomonadota bacterium]